MGQIFVAPADAAVEGPMVFLAGPIQGAVSWHDDAIRILQRLDATLHIASPRRPWAPEREFPPEMYAEQVDWETRHLGRAARCGAVLFWLAAERKEHHRCDRAYAQTTRFELAEWKERHRRGEAKLALGIEPGFTGARYLRRRLAQECPALPIRETLEETCRDAVAACRP